MGVITRTDEAIDSARSNIYDAYKAIQFALDPDTWGHKEYSEEYIETLEDISAQLRKIKRNL